MFPVDPRTPLWFVPSAEPLLMDLIEAATGGVDLLDRVSLPDQVTPPQKAATDRIDAGTAPKEQDGATLVGPLGASPRLSGKS
jgi:hypothetical protein